MIALASIARMKKDKIMHKFSSRTKGFEGQQRGSMWLCYITRSVPLFALSIFLLSTPRSAYPAVFTISSGDVAALISAINTANSNDVDDTINLQAGAYTLSLVHNTTDGNNGLPSITSKIAINGAGADTTNINTNFEEEEFRIFHVAAEGTLSLNGLTIAGGSAPENHFLPDSSHEDISQSGGGILNLGALTINNSVITDNTAFLDGGGIETTGTAILSNTTINDNTAGRSGGGINNFPPLDFGTQPTSGQATLTLSDCTVSDNFAGSGSGSGSGPGDGEGGGIANSATASVSNSTIIDNRVTRTGSAISNTGDFTLTNSTVTDNHVFAGDSDNTSLGGGIANFAEGEFTAHNVTVTLNGSDNSLPAGFLNEGTSTVRLSNTIIAQNRGSDCAGFFLSAGFNLIGIGDGCDGFVAGDLIGDANNSIDASLDTLQDNGGLTQTHALPVDSPAIDAGDNAACPATDQRGLSRPMDGDRDGTAICDIGAFEASYAPGSLQFSAPVYSTDERSAGTITVTRSGGSDGVVTVDLTTSDGPAPTGAIAGVDYQAITSTVTFGDGDVTPKTISIPIVNDVLDDEDETVALTLSNAAGGATLGTPGTALLTIVDDDDPGSLQFDIPSSSATDNVVTLTVSRTGGSQGLISVDFATVDGPPPNGAIGGADYIPTRGTLTFPPGDVGPQTFSVTVLQDTEVELDEQFIATLSNPTGGATLAAPASIEITIVDSRRDDNNEAVLTVNLSPPSSQVVTVDFTTADGTATASNDYTTRAGTLTFNPGETSKRIVVPVMRDAMVESDETFFINLTNGVNAGIVDSQGVVTITDTDVSVRVSGMNITTVDTPPGISINDTTLPESPSNGDGGGGNGGGGGGGGGCTINAKSVPDPTLPVWLIMAALYLWRRESKIERGDI